VSTVRTADMQRDAQRSPAIVEDIFPSNNVMPRGLLRFLIFFSAPMQPGHVRGNVVLLDADGQEIDGAFLDLAQELWDPSRQRLTMLLDPVEPKLKPGQYYTLIVDKGLRDETGRPLAEGLALGFRTVTDGLTDGRP
jgi:hypothetical protein